jgi:hypothetical protein
LNGKIHEKGFLGRPRYGWENDMKIDLGKNLVKM